MPERREFAIDRAPGKDLIQALQRNPCPAALGRFFENRMEWCGGYPLVHDRFVTCGAFDDLLGALDQEQRLALTPVVARLADTAPDQHFHGALSLLGSIIPDDAIRARPAEFSCLLLRLRLRAERLAFLPNLECAWDTLAVKQRCLQAVDDTLASYTPHQLGLAPLRWREFFPWPLVNYTRDRFGACRADMASLRQQIQDLDCAPGSRELIYCTRIETTRYWVWRIPGRSGPAHLWRIVFFRQPGTGQSGLGQWDLFRQFHERDTPEAISTRLLKIEFYPQNLTAVREAEPL